MEQLYGESPEIHIEESYNTNGGIALFSTNSDDTVTGGSGNEGEYPTSTRIRWEITRTADSSSPGGYSYTGGISGDNGWYTEDPNSPFFEIEDTDICEYAFEHRNLNYYFDAWNQDQSQAGQVKRATFALTAATLNCATIIGG